MEYALSKTENSAPVVQQRADETRDVLTGRYYDLSSNLELKSRLSLVLEF